MYKVIHNGTLRAQFINQEDANNFVDILCGTAVDDEIILQGPDDMPIYGFDRQGQYWEMQSGQRVYPK